MKRSVTFLSTTVVILGIVLAAAIFRQPIRDFAVVQTSELSPSSAALLADIELTSDADFIYRASKPEVQGAVDFNSSCSSVAKEQSIVLGCYTRQQFYIYDIKDERLAGVKEVTAAHELLHAVYDRLDTKEKAELDSLLISTADSIVDERFRATIAEYKQSEPDQLANEYHSILATEIEVLPSALETHYQKYFKNRKKIVSYAKQYESAFTSLDNQIKQYDTDLKNLRDQKEVLERTLNQQQAAIESEQQRLNALRSQNNSEEYNAAVPGFNAQIQSYNSNVAQLKQIVAEFNDLVEKRNTLATTQNNLVKQLDSNYQPLE